MTADWKTEKQTHCEKIKRALDKGTLGEIVETHENLVEQYYEDVREQANKSFMSAKRVAWMGFCILFLTVAYVLITDYFSRASVLGFSMAQTSMTAASIGVISGAVIEFIAAINFLLYARASKQFGAFHICLERMHRYLIAYKIAAELKERREETLEALVCIMANAPMIARPDKEETAYKPAIAKTTVVKAVSTEVEKV